MRPSMTLSQEWSALSEAMYGEDFIAELAAFLRQNGAQRILECGCGNGYFLEGLARRGFCGIGIDAEPEMIAMAEQEHAHTNLTYILMNWLNLGRLGETFDAVICRGNSLTYVNSWDKEKHDFDSDTISILIEKSIRIMYRQLKPGGILYLDTVSQGEIALGSRAVTISLPDIELVGRIEHDWQKRARYISGSGMVHGQEFCGDSICYLLTADELVEILRSLQPTGIWQPKLAHEPNYDVVCARK